MTEKQLIAKIQKLKQIKPDASWVVLTKEHILGQEKSRWEWFFKSEKFVFAHKLAFATLTVLIILVGTFGFAQNSVPGDSLFTLKKIAEQGQAIFVSEQNQTKHNLGLASKRLDDLAKIAENNEIKNLAPAIDEYEESVEKVIQDLANVENSYILNELAYEIQKLEEQEEQVKSLGIEIGQNELTEEEAERLNNIKFEYEQGNYSKALEILLLK